MGLWCLNQLFAFALKACVQSGLEYIIGATFQFIQIQAPNIVKADLPTAYKNSFSWPGERSEVWPKNPWAFSDVIHCPEVLCEAH